MRSIRKDATVTHVLMAAAVFISTTLYMVSSPSAQPNQNTPLDTSDEIQRGNLPQMGVTGELSQEEGWEESRENELSRRDLERSIEIFERAESLYQGTTARMQSTINVILVVAGLLITVFGYFVPRWERTRIDKLVNELKKEGEATQRKVVDLESNMSASILEARRDAEYFSAAFAFFTLGLTEMSAPGLESRKRLSSFTNFALCLTNLTFIKRSESLRPIYLGCLGQILLCKREDWRRMNQVAVTQVRTALEAMVTTLGWQHDPDISTRVREVHDWLAQPSSHFSAPSADEQAPTAPE